MSDEGRKALYQALSLMEDSLVDGFISSREVPEFALAPAGAAGARATPTLSAGRRRGEDGNDEPRNGDSLDAIGVEIARCRLCRLAAGRTRVVPGTGSTHPLVMVIGEGPGSEEDKSGIPFVGPAGQLLDRMLLAIGLSRETNCFIGNIVKCRPPMNRDPAPDEQSACIPYLDRQIEVLRPRAFLAVGRIPAQALLGVKDGIGKLRGKRYDYKGVPLVATYHPSALLRDENYKRPAWEDLKLLRSILDGLD
jgi:DNA polymerase